MNDIVLQKLESGLLTITMNRPDRRNALNPEMTLGLVAAARRAAEDHEVRAVLLKGAGGTFCVGGDVKSMAEGRAPLPFEAKMTNLRRGMEVSRVLHQMQKPVVAQVDGAAAGAGLSIALACDLRVASASAKITTAFAKVGLSGDYGGTYFLTHLLGSAKARELYLLSPVLTAQEALALGMVTRVVPDAEVEAAAHDHARLYQAQHQQCRDLVAGGLFRRRGDPSLARRRDRRSQGSRQGVCRETQAGISGPLK
jgi:2-(1,2-epoxy-1,2-dihydrophenyl)acetyl-CoA isomerase